MTARLSCARGRAIGAVAAVGLAFAASGCGLGQRIVASPRDWEAFRQTRVAPTLETRLQATARYLDEHPDGSFREQADGWFRSAEPVYWAAKRGSAAGLSAYVQTLPGGPHAEEARRRLDARREQARQDAAFAGVGAAIETRLARVAAERERSRDEAEAWIRRLVDPEVWRGPVAEAPRSFLVPWSLGLPPPKCSVDEAGERRCVKVVELPYRVAGPNAAEGDDERQITLEIALRQDGTGRPVEATLAGPQLFLRIEEAHGVRPIAADDTAAAIAAVSRVVELTRDAFRERVSTQADCKRPVAAPLVLDLGCAGLRVRVRVGDGAAQDDAIVVGLDAGGGATP